MAKKSDKLPIELTRITRTLYFMIAAVALSIVIFDAGNLIPREAVISRWTLLSILFAANTVAWFIAAQVTIRSIRIIAVFGLSLLLLTFAGLMTYWERGMASTSTLLYALPLLTVATARDRHALIATAALSAGTYALAAVRYFNDFFNEGYRIQLWGNIVLYISLIFICTWLIMIIAGLRHDSK